MNHCFFCGRKLPGDRHGVRKWCQRSKCRDQGRRDAAREAFEEWQAIGVTITDEVSDLESWLLDAAPENAWRYRVSCPGLGNGAARYFPAGVAWMLRPFEAPRVPHPGYYRVLYYGAIGELLGEAGPLAIPSASKGITLNSGDTRRDLNR